LLDDVQLLVRGVETAPPVFEAERFTDPQTFACTKPEQTVVTLRCGIEKTENVVPVGNPLRGSIEPPEHLGQLDAIAPGYRGSLCL
jgi:hypothetical protein